ncbi:MAG: hypothetical protein HC796_09920 [Synechococcaceae cyanobacterium RL_1_2]|nr:hypothetical protein [Synechococcaceae cyanobacterium RL_1_2]
MDKEAVFFDWKRGKWLKFSHRCQTVSTNRLDEVKKCLDLVNQYRQDQGYWVVGYLSYEAAAAFDGALHTFTPTQDFPLLWFGMYENPEIVILGDHHTQPNYQLLGWQPEITAQDYKRSLEQIKEYIKKGDTFQVNFSYRYRGQFEGEPWSLFLALNQAQRSRHGAYLSIGNYVICSASPELFFALDGERIITKPMKGTAPRALDPDRDQLLAQELFNSSKIGRKT